MKKKILKHNYKEPDKLTYIIPTQNKNCIRRDLCAGVTVDIEELTEDVCSGSTTYLSDRKRKKK